MKNNENGKIYYFQFHPNKEKTFTPIQEIRANFDLLKSIELGTGKAIGISSNDELLEWKQEKKAPNHKKNEFPFLLTKPVYHFHKIKFSKVLLNKTMCLGLDTNGNALVWGQHKDGLLGLGYKITSVDNPTRLECLRDIIDIALSDNHAIGINSLGEAFSWGTGKYGELGLDKSIYTPSPLKVNSTKAYFKVIVGNLITCFLDSDGHFSYYGVIIKILKGTFSLITVKNLLNDQSNSDPDILFQEKIIVELEQEQFSSVAIGNGFIALLSKNGMVYTLEHSDKLTALYSKYYVYSLTVANNQILGLSYEKQYSSQTQRITQHYNHFQHHEHQHQNRLKYYFCQYISNTSDRDVSSEIWKTVIYKITEDLHLDSISLLNTNNLNVILIIERGMNLNSSVLLNNYNNSSGNNKANINMSNDISWDNITYNEFQVSTLGIIKNQDSNNTFLVFDCEYDDSYNMKFKRSRLNQERRSISPLLNRTLITDNKSTIQYQYNSNTNHNKSCSSALLSTYTERDNNKRVANNSSINVNNNIETESVEAKEKELKHYQKEIDSIINNFKLRQKEKTSNLKQKIIKHQPKNKLNGLNISNSIESKRRHSSLISNTNPNNNQKSIEKNLHFDTSNVNIETKNNISDIDCFLNKTRNDNSNNNTLMKNELYSDIEEANIFNKSNCNMLDDSSQLKLSSNFVFINPNKSNFLSPQFIKTSRFTKLYSSKESSPNVTLKNTQKNLDQEILSKLKISGNELCGIVTSDSNSALIQLYSNVDLNMNKYSQMNNKGNNSHCNTEANDMRKDVRLDTLSNMKIKQSKVMPNTRSYSNDKNRIPNSYHKRHMITNRDLRQNRAVCSNKPETDANNIITNKDKNVIIDDINEGNGNVLEDHCMPIKNKAVYKRDNNQADNGTNKLRKEILNYEGKPKMDDLNKISTIAYMENSSNFAYSHENLFEETPKFDSKNKLIQESISQRKNYYYKGDNNEDYNQRMQLQNNIRFANRIENEFSESSCNIEDTIPKAIKKLEEDEDNKKEFKSNHENIREDNDKELKDNKELIDRNEDKGDNKDRIDKVNIIISSASKICDCSCNIKENKHATSIRQMSTSSNKNSSKKKDEFFNKNELQSKRLEYNEQNCIQTIQPTIIINENNKTEINDHLELNKEEEMNDDNNRENQQNNNLIFSFEPKTIESSPYIKGKRNKMKDCYDIMKEVNKDEVYRKIMTVNYNSAYFKLKNEFHLAYDDNKNENENDDNDDVVKNQKKIIIQSEKDIKRALRSKKLNNDYDYNEDSNDKVKGKKYISDKKNSHEDENQSIEDINNKGKDTVGDNKEFKTSHQYIDDQKMIKKGLIITNDKDSYNSNEKKETQNEDINQYNNEKQEKIKHISNDNSNDNNIDNSNNHNLNHSNFISKICHSQDNVIDFKKDKTLLSMNSNPQCQMNLIDKTFNNQSSKQDEQFDSNHMEEKKDFNSIHFSNQLINQKVLVSKSLSLNNIIPDPDISNISNNDEAAINIFKYKSSIQKNNQNKLIASQSNNNYNEDNNNEDNDSDNNNDTARLGAKETEEIEDKDYNNKKKKKKKKKNRSKSQLTPSDDSRTHRKNYLIKTTTKEYINQKNSQISTIKDKIKSEENQEEELDSELALSHKHFFNTNGNSSNYTTSTNPKAKLNFDSNKKAEYQSIIEDKNEEVISKLLSKSNPHYSLEQRELSPKHLIDKEMFLPQKKDTTKAKSNQNVDNSFNNNNNDNNSYFPETTKNKERINYKKQLNALPKNLNYRLASQPLVEGILINPEDTFGVNDSSSIDKEAKKNNQSITHDKKAFTLYKEVMNEMKPDDITFLPSTEKKRKNSLSIKIPNEESLINMPLKMVSINEEDQQDVSLNRNSHNCHINDNNNNNNNSNVTEQKIFTLNGYSNENDSSIQHNTSNLTNKNNAVLSQFLDNKSIENESNNENKSSDRIIQLISKIKSSQNQIETSMIKGQSLLKKRDSYIETQSSHSNKNNTNPNNNSDNNDNFYTFSNNGLFPNQSKSNINTNSNGNLLQLNDKYNNLNSKIMTTESKDFNGQQKTRNSKKVFTSNNTSKKQNNKQIKLSTEPNCFPKDNSEVKYKSDKQKDKLFNSNQSNEDYYVSNNQTKTIKSKVETPSCDKGEKSSLVSLLSEPKLIITKGKEKEIASRLINQKNLIEKNIYNKNSFNYFSFLVTDYMKKQVINYCIIKICTYLVYRGRKYSCRLLSRVVKRKIIFYKIKFFHRCNI